MSGTTGSPLWPSPLVSVYLVLLVPVLLLFQLRISRIRIFLANLGVSRGWALATGLIFASALEVAATFALSHLFSA
ncbi:hypothetical protein ACFL5A_05115 [Gemmatimonadota bacterium]